MLQPPAYATADVWADNCRIMPPGSPFPGPWSTDRAPYLREPMRAFADPRTDVVVLMVASQMGKTEAGFNVLGWMWDTHPAPAMWVTPTERLAHTLSKDRINGMFDSVPGLWDRTRKPVRPGSLERWVSGVRFGMAWAGSATELASHPCKYVIVDERSRMGEDTGGEGDPVRIVSARTKMYAGSKVGIFSSPTEEDLCPTYRWWLQGTRYKWCWRCPSCGEWVFPSLEHAGYPEGADYAEIRANSWIECPSCEHQIRDDDRESIEADYIPCVVSDDDVHTLEPALEVVNSVKSYWATGFASHVTGIGRIMEEYARSARSGEPGDLQATVNTYAGELWKIAGEGVPADAVAERVVESVPDADIQLVTVGVDVQENCLYYAGRAWCHGVTSYGLDHGQIYGDTSYDDVYLALARVLDDTFAGRAPAMVLVDSGYQTAIVYEQCRRRPTWAPARGHATLDKPYKDTTQDESRVGRALKGLRLWHHSNDVWKTWLHGRLRWPVDKMGAWYVLGEDEEYARQVTNERFRITRGKRDWYRTGNRENHYGDCEILAAIAADIQGVRRLRKPPPSFARPAAEEAPSRRGQHNPFARRPLGS